MGREVTFCLPFSLYSLLVPQLWLGTFVKSYISTIVVENRKRQANKTDTSYHISMR